MEFLNSLQYILIILISLIVGFMLRSYLPAYFKEKGKNLATKEDIEDITDKIEHIRSDYSSSLEMFKSELNKQLQIHRISFEKEFDILSELWKSLSKLRYATASLRPEGDIIDTRITEEERKKQRLQNFFDSYNSAFEIVQYNRPFYPDYIYDEVNKIMRISMREAIQYKNRSCEYNEKGYDQKYWDKAVENIEQIVSGVDQVCHKIKSRYNVSNK